MKTSSERSRSVIGASFHHCAFPHLAGGNTGEGEKGLSLIELLVAITIFGIIAVGATALLSAALDSHAFGDKRYGLYREGLMIMERITGQVRRCTFLLIPNAHHPTRDILAVSGFTNEDNDNYFDDPLFPRIDEDPNSNMIDDAKPGIDSIDDDGDGAVDEGASASDDDEDGAADEDPLDGKDNDDDGNVDEDVFRDANNDGSAGIVGMDDDGDGSIDEGSNQDDDEDGENNEDPLNPLVYFWEAGTLTLRVKDMAGGQVTTLSTRATAFQVTYDAPGRILVTLTLTGEDGTSVTFSEYVHVENTYQRIGKRVR